MIAGAGLAADPERWLAELEAETLRALEARGEATATELAADVAGLREQIPFGEGKRWQGTLGMSTRVLFGLAAAGRIVRARPRGSWISSQYRWTRMEAWLPGPLVELPTAGGPRRAGPTLAPRGFGPGTVRDLKWWTGWTVAEVRRSLAEIGAVEVELEDGRGYVLPDDGDVRRRGTCGA